MFSLLPRRIHSALVAPLLLPFLLLFGADNVGPLNATDATYSVHGILHGTFPFTDPIFIVSWGPVSHGTLTVAAHFNGFSQESFAYEPNYGYTGDDSFTYHACDSLARCVDGTINLSVVNNAPHAVADSYTLHGILQHGGDFPVTINDSDPDHDSIRVVSVTQASNGTFTYNFFYDSFTYQPRAGFAGTDSVTYTICDNLGLCDSATITLIVVNHPPVANPDDYSTQINQTLFVRGPDALVKNDSDVDNDPFSVTGTTQGLHGRVTYLTAEGILIYEPNQNFVGKDSFGYTVCDYLGACATGTATVDVQGEAPTPTPTPTPVATPTPTPPPPPPPSPTPTPTPVEPLIFIPGIAGSELKTGNGVGVWVGGDPHLLTLDPTQTQQKIIATDVFRKTTILGKEIQGYDKLLKMLTTTGGYREYRVDNKPERRTAAGCDLSQRAADPSHNPSLFLFAYDWRKSNADEDPSSDNSAKALKDYIGCVRKFYPDSKVNILAHSMGGLIARRYILDNPRTHGVRRLVAIATPWLGAPKALYQLETGKFFDTGVWATDFVGNRAFASLFKSLVEFFPSVHQLLPSPSYYKLGGHDFGEVTGGQNWDVNENGRLDNDYTPEELASLLDNKQFTTSKPGQMGLTFHSKPGQDDWQGDESGVQYYLLYGVQYYRFTIGKVLALNKPQFDSEGRTVRVHDYGVTYTRGDHTAPLLSTERIGLGMDLNGAAVKRFPFISHSPFDDDSIEHTALTANPEVWAAILASLKTDSLQVGSRQMRRREVSSAMHHASSKIAPCLEPKQEAALSEGGEAYYIRVTGADRVNVFDAQGNSNTALEGTAFDQRIPGVFMSENETSADINFGSELLSDQSITLTFRSLGTPIEIELTRGKGNAPDDITQVVRYLDVNLAVGTPVMFRVTALGVEPARFDRDGDGVFETIIEATASAIGDSARDNEPPVISITESVNNSDRVITISADDVSGVKTIRYSLDGVRYQRYDGPISVNGCDTRIISAIADDNLGNRSQISSYHLTNLPPDVSNVHPSPAVLWPPNHSMAAVSIMGITDPDCDQVTITVMRITQNEPTNGIGDGKTCPDAEGIGGPNVNLRAERNGSRNGRVYTIHFTATDDKGNSSKGLVKVVVPKTNNSPAGENGSVFDSSTCANP